MVDRYIDMASLVKAAEGEQRRAAATEDHQSAAHIQAALTTAIEVDAHLSHV